MIADTKLFWRQSQKLKREHPDKYSVANIFPFLPNWLLARDRKGNIHESQIWINFAAKKFLDKILQPGMQVFEYGAGGSTAYFAKRVGKVVSVEHHPEWFEMVKDQLRQSGISNVEIILAEPGEISPQSDIEFFDDETENPTYQSKEFEKYVKAIDSYPDGHFDLIFVDGRARKACINRAKSKLKVGGYLVVDNSERAPYFKDVNLEDYTQTDFFGPGPYSKVFWQTSFFKRNQ